MRPTVVVELDPVADDPHGVLRGFEAVTMHTLFLQRPDHPLCSRTCSGRAFRACSMPRLASSIQPSISEGARSYCRLALAAVVRGLALDELQYQRRLPTGCPALDLFFHFRAHRRLLSQDHTRAENHRVITFIRANTKSGEVLIAAQITIDVLMFSCRHRSVYVDSRFAFQICRIRVEPILSEFGGRLH